MVRVIVIKFGLRHRFIWRTLNDESSLITVGSARPRNVRGDGEVSGAQRGTVLL